jgi:hypothetical protein
LSTDERTDAHGETSIPPTTSLRGYNKRTKSLQLKPHRNNKKVTPRFSFLGHM